MTKIQLIRQFASAVAGERVTIARNRDVWAMDLSENYPRLILPTQLDVWDEGDKMFRHNFVERCPMAQGFSHVVLTILHEVGHHFHRIEFAIQDVDEYENAKGEEHFNFPCEVVATDWAIAWLQDKAHRQLAKDFERQYFKAVR